MEKVKNISLKNKGVQLEDGWHTVVGKAANYLDQISKGDEVKVTKDDEGNLTYIKAVNKGGSGGEKQEASPTIPQSSNQVNKEKINETFDEMSDLMEKCMKKVSDLFGVPEQDLNDEQVRVVNTLFMHVAQKR
ncbi:MAG: hypothetical protein ACOCTT_03470 [archaeon]